jgi:Cysteine-rich CPCC
MSEKWFNWYVKQISKEKQWATYRDRSLCPCCFMPTLDERCGWEICPICFWEDDGQDTDDADVVRGGPNHDYSLQEARENFDKYNTMYRPSDKDAFARENKTMVLRMELYHAFCTAVNSGFEIDWKSALKIEDKYYKRS